VDVKLLIAWGIVVIILSGDPDHQMGILVVLLCCAKRSGKGMDIS
jgi:hypothetical protein